MAVCHNVQAAKTVGKTLKSFQPTLQELSQVSNDLKSTLQNEIGLDEFQRDINSIRNPTMLPRQSSSFDNEFKATERATVSGDSASGPASTSTPTSTTPSTATATPTSTATSTPASNTDADLLALRKAFAPPPAPGAGNVEEDIEKMRAESAAMAWGNIPQELSREDATPREEKPKKKALEDMTMVELEAELAKRKALIAELSREA